MKIRNNSKLEKILIRASLGLFLGGLAIPEKYSDVVNACLSTSAGLACVAIPLIAYNNYSRENKRDYQT